MNVEIFLNISYPDPLRQNLCCPLILLRNRSDIRKLFVNLQLYTVGTKRPALGDEGDAFVAKRRKNFKLSKLSLNSKL